MPLHVVRQGECLATIARQFGFSDWRDVYAAQSDDFKQQRPNPNVLMPGDQLQIPELRKKEFGCSTGISHKFQVKGPKAKLRVRLQDHKGKALAGKKYKLVVGKKTFEGSSDGDGMVDQLVPVAATTGKLTVFVDDKTSMTMNLNIGHLDPEEAVSGTQARLQNLGYFAGGVDGAHSDDLAAAIRQFQRTNGLEESGALDDPTRAKLRQMHDGG